MPNPVLLRMELLAYFRSLYDFADAMSVFKSVEHATKAVLPLLDLGRLDWRRRRNLLKWLERLEQLEQGRRWSERQEPWRRLGKLEPLNPQRFEFERLELEKSQHPPIVQVVGIRMNSPLVMTLEVVGVAGLVVAPAVAAAAWGFVGARLKNVDRDEERRQMEENIRLAVIQRLARDLEDPRRAEVAGDQLCRLLAPTAERLKDRGFLAKFVHGGNGDN